MKLPYILIFFASNVIAQNTVNINPTPEQQDTTKRNPSLINESIPRSDTIVLYDTISTIDTIFQNTFSERYFTYGASYGYVFVKNSYNVFNSQQLKELYETTYLTQNGHDFNLQANYIVNDWSVESGLNYVTFREKFSYTDRQLNRVDTGIQIQTIIIDTIYIGGQPIYVEENRFIEIYDSVFAINQWNRTNRFKFLEIPILLKRHISLNKKISLEAGGGLFLSILYKSSGKTLLEKKNREVISMKDHPELLYKKFRIYTFWEY